MHHFTYRNGRLCAEEVDLVDLAEHVGTPFYCYATATLDHHCRILAEAFRGLDHLVCYAMKANSNQAVLATLAGHGLGMDVVSEGELRRARAAGVPGGRIIFAGVGKTRAEMAYALAEDILGFNVESWAELEALSSVAHGMGRTARVALRVNPDVDALTHAKISTGKSENKFGIPYAEALALYRRGKAMPGIVLTGIHMHIGSQITELTPFRAAFKRMRTLVNELQQQGIELAHLDLGGGLGVPYDSTAPEPPSPRAYGDLVREELGGLGLKLIVEPGRMIVGNAGVLVTRVIYSKDSADRTFTIVDAAMNDLIRPTLYDAYHEIRPLLETVQQRPATAQDVVGPVCETGDYLALGRVLPRLESGDLIAVMTAGAYGAVMASTYNSRPLVPEVLVTGARHAIVRRRPTLDELIALDQLPPWLGDAS